MSGEEKHPGFVQKDIGGVDGSRTLPPHVDVPFPGQQHAKRYDPAFEVKVSTPDENPVGRNVIVRAWKDPRHALTMKFYIDQAALASMSAITKKLLINEWLRQVEEYLEDAIDMGVL